MKINYKLKAVGDLKILLNTYKRLLILSFLNSSPKKGITMVIYCKVFEILDGMIFNLIERY